MRILYVSHYFPPEMGAPAGRVAGLGRTWVREGHEVHVLTGFPHHPTGVVPAEYRAALRRGYLRENLEGVTVHRTWIYPAANRGKLLRSVNYLSFMLSAAATGSLRIPRPDVVVATSPQLLCAAAGMLLACRFRVPLVMEVRDLWPESLVAVGASRTSSPLVQLLEAVAHALYRSAEHIVTVTEAQRAAIVASGIGAQRVTVIPNGVDDSFMAQVDRESSARAAGEFVVTYIGTLGMAHHLETLLEAAHAMRKDPAVRFQLVGEGARRAALEEKARALDLRNVTFIGERPRDEVARWICSSDACLVLLRQTPVFHTVVPSKMLEIMAAGCPMVLGVAGEASTLLERAGAGIAIEPENSGQLVAALHRLRADAALRRTLGDNGRRFVAAEFKREQLAARYLGILKNLSGAVRPVTEKPYGETEPASEAR
jgi:glycosyltransferase involved in cell wall biosynthesis